MWNKRYWKTPETQHLGFSCDSVLERNVIVTGCSFTWSWNAFSAVLLRAGCRARCCFYLWVAGAGPSCCSSRGLLVSQRAECARLHLLLLSHLAQVWDVWERVSCIPRLILLPPWWLFLPAWISLPPRAAWMLPAGQSLSVLVSKTQRILQSAVPACAVG